MWRLEPSDPNTPPRRCPQVPSAGRVGEDKGRGEAGSDLGQCSCPQSGIPGPGQAIVGWCISEAGKVVCSAPGLGIEDSLVKLGPLSGDSTWWLGGWAGAVPLGFGAYSTACPPVGHRVACVLSRPRIAAKVRWDCGWPGG